MKKVTIRELAQILGVDSDTLLGKVRGAGFDIKTDTEPIDPAEFPKPPLAVVGWLFLVSLTIGLIIFVLLLLWP